MAAPGDSMGAGATTPDGSYVKQRRTSTVGRRPDEVGTGTIEIRFCDGSSKTFRSDAATTASVLAGQVADKIGLGEERRFFAIFVENVHVGLEIEVPPEVHPNEVKDNWAHYEVEYKNAHGVMSPTVKFKRSQRVSSEMEASLVDPKSLELIYHQAVEDVILSRYIFSKDDTTELVGMQIQANLGDNRKDVHKPGYYTKTNSLAAVTPSHMLASKKFNAEKWEKAIFKAHAKATGMTQDDARKKYLALVRSCPYYGCVLFDAHPAPSGKAKLPKDIMLAMSPDYIHIIELATMKPALTFDRKVKDKETATSLSLEAAPTEQSSALRLKGVDHAKKGHGDVLEINIVCPSTGGADLALRFYRGDPADILMNVAKFLEKLEEQMIPESYTPGSSVFNVGEPGRSMYFLIEGTVEVEIPAKLEEGTGRELEPVKIVQLKPGAYFGEIALFLSRTGTRTASVKAIDNVQLLVLTKSTCDDVLYRYPKMQKAFAEVGQQRLNSGAKGGKAQPSWLTGLATMAGSKKATAPKAAGAGVQRQLVPGPPTLTDAQTAPWAAPWNPDKPFIFNPCGSFNLECPKTDRAVFDPFVNVIEDPPWECDWYRRMFTNKHDVYMASAEEYEGVCVVTVLPSALDARGPIPAGVEASPSHVYWVIVWMKRCIMRRIVEANSGDVPLPELLQRIDPQQFKHAAKQFKKVEEDDGAMRSIFNTLKKIEDDTQTANGNHNFKMGILLSLEGQTVENDMYGNKDATPSFRRFLELIGQMVTLKGYKGPYVAQLDVHENQSGLTSYINTHRNYNMMYHVSTCMHYDVNDDQYIQRKRFIGNDIVMLVFVDGKTPYAVDCMRSQYTNFIGVVQPVPDHPDLYHFACGTKKGLRPFGPFSSSVFSAGPHFVNFLLSKCLNGEMATCLSPEFLIRERRTRVTYLDMLFNDYKEKIKKPTSVTAAVGITNLETAELQAFKLRAPPLHAAVPQAVRCAHVTKGFVYYGTSQGVYRTLVGEAAPEVQQCGLKDVLQIESCGNDVFVLAGMPDSRVSCLTYDDIMKSDLPLPSAIPGAKGNLFAVGKCNGKFFLCLAADNVVMVYARRSDGSFRGDADRLPTPDMPFRSRVTSLSMTPYGVVVGVAPVPASSAKGADAANASFHFFDLGVDFAHSYAPIHEARNELEEARAAMCPRGTNGKMDNGILLCYSKYGVRLDHSGQPDRTCEFEWMAPPLAFSCYGPFVALYYSCMVEIRSALNGAVIEVHRLNVMSPFMCSGEDGIIVPCALPDGTGAAVLHALVPRVEDERRRAAVENHVGAGAHHDGDGHASVLAPRAHEAMREKCDELYQRDGAGT